MKYHLSYLCPECKFIHEEEQVTKKQLVEFCPELLANNCTMILIETETQYIIRTQDQCEPLVREYAGLVNAVLESKEI